LCGSDASNLASILPDVPREALQLPFSREDASQVGRKVFRKQVLPLGKIEHKDGTLDVTPEYVADLAENFNAGAFDQVAFLLADGDNKHHMDPEKYRGEVKGLEATDKGLEALVELTDEGAKVVGDNPGLGVSARIIKGAKDGKDAIQHVLGTLDPRAKGMAPWEQVNLSDDDTEVTDLTEAEVVSPEPRSTSSTVTPPTKTDATDLTAEDAERIFSDMLAAASKGDDDKPITLSTEQVQAIELANRNANAADERARKAEAKIAEAEFRSERREYELAGVPPYMLDLAEPILTGESKSIELSNGQSVDPQKVIREILDKSKGSVDLSEAVGVGSGDSEDRDPAVSKWVKGEGDED
jgi:hypothetical protein